MKDDYGAVANIDLDGPSLSNKEADALTIKVWLELSTDFANKELTKEELSLLNEPTHYLGRDLSWVMDTGFRWGGQNRMHATFFSPDPARAQVMANKMMDNMASTLRENGYELRSTYLHPAASHASFPPPCSRFEYYQLWTIGSVLLLMSGVCFFFGFRRVNRPIFTHELKVEAEEPVLSAK